MYVDRPAYLFGLTVVLSNLVSNVPAVMLLLPFATHPLAGPILALSATLAGNLLVVGSIANIIVIDQARRLHIDISWREHARIGIPVTVATLALAAAWLWAFGGDACKQQVTVVGFRSAKARAPAGDRHSLIYRA